MFMPGYGCAYQMTKPKIMMTLHESPTATRNPASLKIA